MKECGIDDLALAHEKGAIVVDVREPAEYVTGHVPGALLMPLAQVGSRVSEIPAGDPVYVICASGNRSKAASALVENAGREAYSVAGGTKAWIASGRPVVEGMR